MKERYRKQKFLKNFGLQTNKNPRPEEQENDFTICERLCFYYFDDDAQVICRGCYGSFKTWLDFRLHFNISCQISETDYKLNTYNDVYKKYKLRKAKTKKKINDRLSVAQQLMDIETLNTRKTRKRCYTNTRVVENNMLKSPSDSSMCSSNSAKTVPIKRIKKEALNTCISDDETTEETKTVAKSTILPVQNIPPDSTKTDIPNPPHDNRLPLPTVKAEWNADDLSQASSDDQSSSSTHCHPKYRYKENKSLKYQYFCVICDERFLSKCLLTMHQVQHIKSDRSSYRVFMAELARSA